MQAIGASRKAYRRRKLSRQHDLSRSDVYIKHTQITPQDDTYNECKGRSTYQNESTENHSTEWILNKQMDEYSEWEEVCVDKTQDEHSAHPVQESRKEAHDAKETSRARQGKPKTKINKVCTKQMNKTVLTRAATNAFSVMWTKAGYISRAYNSM